MNQDSYSLGFNQPQPPQSPVIHQPPQELNIQEMEDLKQQYLDELKRLILKFKKKEKLLQQEQWAYLSTHPSKHLTSFCYDDDDDGDYNSAITPVLSIEEPVDSLIPSELKGIPEHMCDVPFHENSPPLDVSKDQFKDFSESNDEVSSSDKDSFSIYNIDYVEASPPDSELVSSEVMEIVILETKSSSTSLNSFLEETNTFHISLPKFENFYFDLGEISSGSTTTHSDISLPDYEAFSVNDDHIKEISSGSTTTHFDISLSEYDSFIFDLTHEEFVDELAHIISPPEYDCFYFRNLPDSGELMFVLNSGIREKLSTTLVNFLIEDDYSPLLAYIVWIFVAYLTYPVIPPYLHPFGNEDTIFDPVITINHFYSSKPGSSHWHGAFKKFNTHCSHLNEWPMIINGKNTPLLDVLFIPGNLKTLAKGFYPPSLKFPSFNWESNGYSQETDTQENDKNKAKNDKTEHEMEKIEKDKVIRSRKSKSNPTKLKQKKAKKIQFKGLNVKENQEKDKIRSKPDKNGKRIEAGKSLKLLQWIKEKNQRKRKKNGRKRIHGQKVIQIFKDRRKDKGLKCNYNKVQPQGPILPTNESCMAKD
nr:hypothetical protein [Tanacetum cinerariifolium]